MSHLWQLPTYQSEPIKDMSTGNIPGPWAPSIRMDALVSRISDTNPSRGKIIAVGDVTWSRMTRRVRGPSLSITASIICFGAVVGNGMVATRSLAPVFVATYWAAFRTEG